MINSGLERAPHNKLHLQYICNELSFLIVGDKTEMVENLTENTRCRYGKMNTQHINGVIVLLVGLVGYVQSIKKPRTEGKESKNKPKTSTAAEISMLLAIYQVNYVV